MNFSIKTVILEKKQGVTTMSLKVNQQVDLETLFNKFALDPVEPPKKKAASKQAEAADKSEKKPRSKN